MERYEIFTKLTELEGKKKVLTSLLQDTEDNYFESATIEAMLKSTAYTSRREYEDGTSFVVDKLLFIQYLKLEIENVDSKVDKLIGELKQGN